MASASSPFTPALLDQDTWENHVTIVVVDGVAICSGHLLILDTAAKAWGHSQPLLRTMIPLDYPVTLHAPCTGSRGGSLRKAGPNSPGRCTLIWTTEGEINLTNLQSGKSSALPAQIFFSGLYVVITPFSAPPPILRSVVKAESSNFPGFFEREPLTQHAEGVSLRYEEKELTKADNAPAFRNGTPAKCTVRGRMVYLSGYQGEAAWDHSATSEGQAIAILPQDLLPQAAQTLKYWAHCGGTDSLPIGVEADGQIRAWSASSVMGSNTRVKGSVNYHGVAYSMDPGDVLYLGTDDLDADGFDDVWLDTEDAARLTYRHISNDVIFIQGSLDMNGSTWSAGKSVGQLPRAPRIRETFEVNGVRIDINTHGQVFFPEETKNDFCAEFHILVYVPDVAPSIETEEDDGAVDLDRPVVLSRYVTDHRRRGGAADGEHMAKIHSLADRAKYKEITEFFHAYSTSGSDITHPCLAGSYKNPFTKTGKWHFPDTPEIHDKLCHAIAWLYRKGIPCYMVERQTNEFPFIEDLDIQAYVNWDWLGGLDYTKNYAFTLSPDYLIIIPPEISDSPGRFMIERALCVHKCYPHFDKLDVLVYQASGFNKNKGLLKSSYHLVWRQIIVDKHSAPRIREETLEHFVKISTEDQTGYWTEFARLLKVAHPSNSFDMVFDKTTVTDKNGLRMPFNDKAKCDRIKIAGRSKPSIVGITKEERPQIPVGILEFEFQRVNGESTVTKAQWVGDKYTYSIEEWIKVSSCRRPKNTPITSTSILIRRNKE